ncbi:MAG: nucleoside/nucleotide kinase family protein [Acidimicrobiaceae bacterium]|nr:nucleoside/nucleotide kinase family protein [Acidimicrobiaceae bacterium]
MNAPDPALAELAECPPSNLWEPSLSELVLRARQLSERIPRAVLGICGQPGAGKSTLAAHLVTELGPLAALVPMDGFHLAQAELERLGRAQRKGAPDTFDALGYVALLQRLRGSTEEVVYAPSFRRDLEEPIAGAIPVGPQVRLVVTEGNYLLDTAPGWVGVRPLLDEAWYVETDENLRLERLVARHIAFGKEPAAARAWALGPDQENARRIAEAGARADLVVRVRD